MYVLIAGLVAVAALDLVDPSVEPSNAPSPYIGRPVLPPE